MKQFVLEQTDTAEKFPTPCSDFPEKQPLTEIYVDDIYFCKEYRLVSIQGHVTIEIYFTYVGKIRIPLYKPELSFNTTEPA